MPKSVMPFFEPLPYYMSAMGMQGARFIEGPSGGEPPVPTPPSDPEPPADPVPDPKPGPDPADELGEGGKKALESERDARKAAEKLVKESTEAIANKDSEIQSLTAQVSEKDSAIAAKDLEIAKLKALIDFPVKKELQGLIQGTDEASYRASAELLYKNTAGAGVVHKSGTSGGTPNPSGGSVAAGREMFTATKPKKVGA